MGNALILVNDGFTDSEYTYALDRCREEDIDICVASLTGNHAIGEKGWVAKADISIDNVFGVVTGNVLTAMCLSGPFDILILPGGVKSIEKMRQSSSVIKIIQAHDRAGKIIASMCHGAQLLIESDIAYGRTISGYYSIKTDIENAGAHYKKEIAIDGNIVSAPHYDFNGKWMKAVIELYKVKQLGR